MSYDKLRQSLEPGGSRMRSRVWDTVAACRGSLDPRQRNRLGTGGRWRDERVVCETCGGNGCDPEWYFHREEKQPCKPCNGSGYSSDPEDEADAGLAASPDAIGAFGWYRLIHRNANVYRWVPRVTPAGDLGISTAQLRARLPINGALETVECQQCRKLGLDGWTPDTPGYIGPRCKECEGRVPVVERIPQRA